MRTRVWLTIVGLVAAAVTLLPAGLAAQETPGSVAAGARVYQQKGCVGCHGPNLDGQGTFPPLVGRQAAPDFPSTQVLFDYIRRSMPYTAPGSLTDEETYSVVAFLLNKNGLLSEDGMRSSSRSMPGLMDHRSRERKNTLQPVKLLPVHPGFLAASLESFEPHALDQLVELAQ